MMHDWGALYLLSWRLGARGLLHGGPLRESLIRLAIPLDPSRYIELPDALRRLDAKPGERVLDLASPKLAAVQLAKRGVHVTVADLFEPEIATWRRLAGHVPGLTFETADGRDLPYPDGSFDHAYSISVLEHIADDGDFPALAELARVVRPGGRVVLTMPFARTYREDWHERPAYTDAVERRDETSGTARFFFQRWNDQARLDRLLASVPELEVDDVELACLLPRLLVAGFDRYFPAGIALGPFYGLLLSEVTGDDGDVVRVTLSRRAASWGDPR